VIHSQRLKGVVKRNEIRRLLGRHQERFLKGDERLAAAAAPGQALSRLVDQDAPHHPGRHRKKMRTVLPLHLPQVDQSKVGFIHEGRRLQYVTAALARHVLPRETPKLPMDKRHELVEGLPVSLSPGDQQRGDVVRGDIGHRLDTAILGGLRVFDARFRLFH
jgi:hypothetical protein